jgi:hypothetical protein
MTRPRMTYLQTLDALLRDLEAIRAALATMTCGTRR